MKWRLVPVSLFGRLLAALLGTIGVTLLIVVALLLRERSDLLTAGSETAAIVNVIAAAIEGIEAMPAEERSGALERLRNDGLLIDGAAARSRQGPFVLEDTARAAAEIDARLERVIGDRYAVTATPAAPGPSASAIRVGRSGLALLFERGGMRRGGERRAEVRRADEDRGPSADSRRPRGQRFSPPLIDVVVGMPDGTTVAFRADVPRAPPPLPTALLLELGLVTLLLAGVLYAMARAIARPLAELASAAEAVGRGVRSAPLRETGAREIRDAIRAFNNMQERLHRYLDSRTRVLAAMSHDLRTPLTRLKLRTERLEDESLRERFNADLDEMSRMVTGALALFKGLNRDEPTEPVRIEALLEELRAEFEELEAKVTVSGSVAEPVSARRDALKRCLTNLLTNAVKYGGGAVVHLQDEGTDVVVSVQDEGPGIPDAMLERVFEPFLRLEGSRNADTGGVGLGLSIARDIAQAHGGSLVLRNRAGRGLEAILRLPKTPPS